MPSSTLFTVASFPLNEEHLRKIITILELTAYIKCQDCPTLCHFSMDIILINQLGKDVFAIANSIALLGATTVSKMTLSRTTLSTLS